MAPLHHTVRHRRFLEGRHKERHWVIDVISLCCKSIAALRTALPQTLVTTGVAELPIVALGCFSPCVIPLQYIYALPIFLLSSSVWNIHSDTVLHCKMLQLGACFNVPKINTTSAPKATSKQPQRKRGGWLKDSD